MGPLTCPVLDLFKQIKQRSLKNWLWLEKHGSFNFNGSLLRWHWQFRIFLKWQRCFRSIWPPTCRCHFTPEALAWRSKYVWNAFLVKVQAWFHKDVESALVSITFLESSKHATVCHVHNSFRVSMTQGPLKFSNSIPQYACDCLAPSCSCQRIVHPNFNHFSYYPQAVEFKGHRMWLQSSFQHSMS